MIELCIPLWYRLTNKSRILLWGYQMKTYGFKLQIPSYPSPDIAKPAILLTTEEADRLMRQPPHHPKRIRA